MSFDSNEESVDIVKLINEVKIRPELWDYNSEGYKNKHKKPEIWKDIVRQFIENLDDLSRSERNNIIKTYKKKWKNARDAYIRDLKNRIFLGDDTKREYVNFSRLSFLLSQFAFTSDVYNINKVPADDSLSHEKIVLDCELSEDVVIRDNGLGNGLDGKMDEEAVAPASVQTSVEPILQPKVKSTSNKQVLKKSKKRVEQKTSNSYSEADVLFGKFIAKELEHVPEAVKLNVKIEIMKILSLAKTQHTSTP